MEKITGTIEEVIFYNEDNGYCVADIDSNGVLITIVGNIMGISPGESITVEGEYKTHPVYGHQFSVRAFSKTPPNSIDSIYKYLSSGMIKGIRSATAKKIVDAFGTDSLNVIENTPEKLADIKGISIKKAYEIGNSYITQFGVRNIVMFLQEYDISIGFSGKIFKKFGYNAIEKIRANPYILCEQIHGIGFKTADKIALKLGGNINSQERVKAGVKYVLQEFSSSGHTFCPEYLLVKKGAAVLQCDESVVGNAITELSIERGIIIEKKEDFNAVYLPSMHVAEKNVAYILKQLNAKYPEKETPELVKIIEKVEKHTKITLNSAQKKAVINALTMPVLVITGGPGTGKTTVINTIINAMELSGKTVTLAAPTGRAAKRISELSGREAKTIHRLLESNFSCDEDKTVFSRNETNPLDAKAVIIDEMSMVDLMLFNSLLKAIPEGTTLIMVGDADQLPSVGPGNVLRDIIRSGGIETVQLTEIFRQAQESMIVVNAHRINSGLFPYLNEQNKDFFFIKRQSPEQIISTIVELVKTRLPKTYDLDPFCDIQVLTPTRKGAVGVNSLNKALQEALNPPENRLKTQQEIGGILFRELDKVMQIKNNYDIEWESANQKEIGLGLFNGDIGIVEKIDKEYELMNITFDGEKEVIYPFSYASDLEQAYATTIHKSQGSEFPVVIIPMFPAPISLMSRNLLYTAVTRAKKLVVLVGQAGVLEQMVKNNSEVNRFSGLKERLMY
ncbi:MAG: ATP-dependent RecD-like DNA helicase [Clostridia bacterium]|nr:ATP-dependent RecD-like DNA helicase [Clostridia bacterium]